MCGIVGYVGDKQAAPIVLEGLARLEYRGYDSAGIAVLGDDGLVLERDIGRLSRLRERLGEELPRGTTAIGHTRWATHGKATVTNAHPHVDTAGDVVVIHNGIVENFRELRDELMAQGCVFQSETDTEVIPHLIATQIAQGLDLEAATRAAARRLEGAAALVVMRQQEPGVLIAVRIANAGGVVIGFGEGETFVASDLPALLEHTRTVVFLEDGDVARVTASGATFSRLSGEPMTKIPQTLDIDARVVGKGIYDTFMAKEIAEQPEAVLDTFRGAAQFEPPAVILDELRLTDADVQSLRRVILVGMGTSWHAAMIGRTFIEQLAGLPAEFDNASEYRYRAPVIDASTLVVAVAQSGETVDTLAAMHEAKARGARVVAVCNTPGSAATRAGDGAVFSRCGLEIGVASTKTLLGSITALYLLACNLGERRGFLTEERLAAALDDLARMPSLIGEALKTEPAMLALAERYCEAEHFLFLGRGLQYPVAMEGALKLKEVSYIHAEGYAAGEMKHGPIALIDERMPVVAIAVHDSQYAKILNNIEQVRARDGIILALATEGDMVVPDRAQDTVFLPPAPELLQPLLTIVPLQYLAYHIARLRGCDIDQPRNLAKTVTVE